MNFTLDVWNDQFFYICFLQGCHISMPRPLLLTFKLDRQKSLVINIAVLEKSFKSQKNVPQILIRVKDKKNFQVLSKFVDQRKIMYQ